uniref:Secreted protein n=1 Tax=Mesocestoides corti TaxID=53468 RepID=A0A5K3FH08_MESCO
MGCGGRCSVVVARLPLGASERASEVRLATLEWGKSITCCCHLNALRHFPRPQPKAGIPERSTSENARALAWIWRIVVKQKV